MTVVYNQGHRAPIVLNIMIHVYSLAETFETSGYRHSSARTAALKYLLAAGCIKSEPSDPCGYAPTPKGVEYMQKLLDVVP